jgi:asparagine synthase (glutamine-hydrolysing)
MEDLLPKEVAWRRKKMGFPFPYERFVSESGPVMDMIFARAHNPFVDLSRRAALEQSWKAMSFVLWYELYFNENVGLFEDIQETARRQGGPARDYGYTPEYLRSYQEAIP